MNIIINTLPRILVCMAGLALATSGRANPIPYGNPGTQNPTNYTFTAANTGDVIGYFAAQSAGYGSMVGLSINGASPLSYGLQNHSNSYGASFNMGSVNAGDTLRFVLAVSTWQYFGPSNPFSPSFYLNSDTSLNSDGYNHIYSYSYISDSIIPSGIYVGFEDIFGGGDQDYNDHQFVFTNVSSNVPEAGSSLALMGLAMIGLATLRRRFAK